MQFITGWGEYIAAFLTFFVSHRLPLRPGIKGWITARLGAHGFTLAYSLFSIAVLAWVIAAAGRAPYVEIWAKAPWAQHAALTLMAIATGIFALAIGRPNPLSFGGARNHAFDPTNPGLIGWMRHPLLVVLGLWSLAHILPNGDLAHLLMFGQFAVFSVLGMWIIDRRQKRILGQAEWARLADTAREVRPNPAGIMRLGLGGAAYLGLLWLHLPVIGVDPLGY